MPRLACRGRRRCRRATGPSATGRRSSGASPSSACSATASRTPSATPRPSLLLVLGEAGVGKSRLAEELASHAECEHDALVLEGRCVPYGEANVWWPVADALRHGCGIRSSDPADDGDRAGPHVGVHRARRGRRRGRGRPGRTRACSTSWATTPSCAASTPPAPARRPPPRSSPSPSGSPRSRPVVVVLSDLHWADDLVLELVDTLLERLWPPAVRRAGHRPPGRSRSGGTRRTAGTTSWCSPSTRSRPTRPPRSSCELAGAELDAGAGRRRCSTAAAATRSSSRSSSRSSPTPAWSAPTAPRRPPRHVELPDTLRGLVAARLDGLTPDERRVLDDCAVLGRRGPMTAIEVMAGKHLGIDNVRPVLESLEAKELLVLSGTGDGEKWTFRSDLVREVAYSTLTKADRARLALRHRLVDGGARGDRRATPSSTGSRSTTCAPPSSPHELGPVDGPAVRPHRAGPALAGAGRRPRQPGRASRSSRSASTARASACWPASTALATAPSSPAGPAPSPGCGRSRPPAPTRSPRSRRAARAATTASRDLGRVAARARRHRAEGVELGRVGGGARRGRPRVRGARRRVRRGGGAAAPRLRRPVPPRVRRRHRAARAGAGRATRRSTTGAAWRGCRQNLAWCAFYSGRAEEAEVLLRKAAATFEEIGDQGGLALGPRPARLDALPAGPLGRGRRDGRGGPRPTTAAAATGGRSA